MRFGPYLGSGAATRSDLIERAVAAEELGFDSVWMGDHIIIPKQFDRDRYPYRSGLGGGFPSTADVAWYESISALCFLAGVTTKVKLGLSTLVVPYRNPILAAKMMSTLDVLSEGRLVLGVGTGWMKEEYDALKTAPYEDRGAVTDEYIEIFIELWTQENPTYNGKHYQVSGIGFLPKPVQRPHPEIWVGGHTGRAFKRLAKYGQGWQPHMLSPDDIAAKQPSLKRYFAEQGRDLSEIETAVSARLEFTDTPSSDKRLPLTGTSVQILDDIRRYQEVGVTEIRFSGTASTAGAMIEIWKRFAQEIKPKV